MKFRIPRSLLLHRPQARFTSYSILTFLHCIFSLKHLPVCLSLSVLELLYPSPASSFPAVPLWETITDQLPSLPNWFPFPLRLTSFFFCIHCPAVSSPLHLFQFPERQHFPRFLSRFLSLFFFFLNFLNPFPLPHHPVLSCKSFFVRLKTLCTNSIEPQKPNSNFLPFLPCCAQSLWQFVVVFF